MLLCGWTASVNWNSQEEEEICRTQPKNRDACKLIAHTEVQIVSRFGCRDPTNVSNFLFPPTEPKPRIKWSMTHTLIFWEIERTMHTHRLVHLCSEQRALSRRPILYSIIGCRTNAVCTNCLFDRKRWKRTKKKKKQWYRVSVSRYRCCVGAHIATAENPLINRNKIGAPCVCVCSKNTGIAWSHPHTWCGGHKAETQNRITIAN